LPHFPNLDGTDAHLWFGWYGGKVADLAGFASTLPRQVRFVSAFGAQSLTDDDVDPASTDDEVVTERSDPASTADTAGTEPDWEQLAARGVEVDTLRRVVPFAPPQDLRSWAQATRDHQADVVRSTIETLRRLKYRPTGGFSVHRLVDPEGHPGFGLLGADGSAKPAWDALRAACRPLVVIADPFPEPLASGDAIDLAVHVVSDEHVARPGCLVTASLRSAGGNRTWRWQGDIGADECVLVGRIKWTADDIPGPVELELQLEHDGTTVTNRYSGRIR
jgi:beta-mannosidase